MFDKVHIIDDDEISIFLTEAMLDVMQFAHKYKGFTCPQNALQNLVSKLQTGDTEVLPDVIFLDLNMPFISGWELLDSLQNYEDVLLKKCRIYILTSSVSEEEVEKANQYKLVAGFLQKPLDEQSIAHINSNKLNLA